MIHIIYCEATTVLGNKKIAPGIYRIKLLNPKVAQKAKPGQFVTIKCYGGTFLWRPFSIGLVEKEKYIYLFYKVVGRGTTWLSQVKKGEMIDVLGPLGGEGFTINPDLKTPLLIAGGIGVAPLFFLSQRLVALKKKIHPVFLIGANTAPSVILPPIGKRTIEVRIATEDGSCGFKGKITELLEKTILECKPEIIYATGPRLMLWLVALITQQHQIPCEVSLETTVACGVGACLGCTIFTKSGPQRICREGPIFDATKVLWEEYVEPHVFGWRPIWRRGEAMRRGEE